jgi:hypothetical protein
LFGVFRFHLQLTNIHVILLQIELKSKFLSFLKHNSSRRTKCGHMSEDVTKISTYSFGLKPYIYIYAKKNDKLQKNIYEYFYKNVRCEFLTTVNLNIKLFGDVTRCSLANT